MAAGVEGTTRPLVLRQAGAVLVPVAVWVFCVVAVADAVVEGSAGYALRVVVLMSCIAFAVWMVLSSPCLVVLRDGLRVVNPLRVHWVPFAALETVRVRGLTTVSARHSSGRVVSITSWNGPGLPRRSGAETAPVTATIERFRAAWERTDSEDPPVLAVTTWRWGPALALLGLLAANVTIWSL